MTSKDLSCKIISMAESIRAEVLFDIAMKVEFNDFAKTMFQKNILDTKKLHNAIYKYNC